MFNFHIRGFNGTGQLPHHLLAVPDSKQEMDDSSDGDVESSQLGDGDLLLTVNDGDDSDDVSETEWRGKPSRRRRAMPTCTRVTRRRAIIITALLLALCVVLGVAIGLSKRSNPNVVIKPATDTRSYDVITLSNGLRALLISDPKADHAAAALTVNVGSMSDPEAVQGLAHFCEHMLFLGTDKYPNEDNYSTYLAEHGGYDNAFTAQEETNYHFKVERAALRGALDRFSQFFIAPLFTASSTGREMNAVDSEHRKNVDNDEWRFWQLIKSLSDRKSPFHKFSTGNIQTLNISGIHDQLLTFYRSHYSANQMQLAVLGREDLHVLETWIRDLFSQIPNRQAKAPQFTNVPFPSDHVGKRVWIQSVSDGHKLQLYWSLGPGEEIGSYLAVFLGDEGPGSVLSVLRNLKWATALSAGNSASTSFFSLYAITIALTDAGLANYAEVVHYLFRYISLMKTGAVQKSRWDEYIAISDVNFRYKPKEDPDAYVTSLASKMRVTKDPASFLGSPSVLVYNPHELDEAISSLSPKNLILFIASSSFGGNKQKIIDWPDLDQTDKWYGTRYHNESIPSDLLKSWENVKDPKGLALLSKNKFIPKNFDLLPSQSVNFPQKISDNENVVWWQPDVSFLQPKANLYFSLKTPFGYENPRFAAMAYLYRTALLNLLYEPLYAATLVSFTYSVDVTYTGLSVTLSGFSDLEIMSKFVNDVFGQFGLGNSKDVGFDVAKEQVKLFYLNYPTSQQPYKIAYDYSNVGLEKTRWPFADEMATLDNISESAFLSYATKFLNTVNITCFAYGNLNKDQALAYVKQVTGAINPSSANTDGVTLPQRIQLLSGNSYILRMNGLEPSNLNSAIRVIYQVGKVCFLTKPTQHSSSCAPELVRRAALLNLLELKIKNPCFDQLRTKEQLGYIVACVTHRFENIASFQVIIQSATYSADHLRQRAEFFLESFMKTIDSLNSNPSDFNALKQSAADQLTSRDLSLTSASDRRWTEITAGEYQFDRNEQIANATATISAGEVGDFYRDYIAPSGSQRRRFIVELYGKGQSFPMVATEPNTFILGLNNLTQFKQTANAYFHP